MSLLLSLLLSWVVQAEVVPSDLALAQKNFSAYLACDKSKTDKTFVQCISSVVSPNTQKSAIKKLARNLFMGFPASALHTCDKSDKVQPAERTPEYLYYCFTIPGKTPVSTQYGYAKFAKIKNNPRLAAVYYGFE